MDVTTILAFGFISLMGFQIMLNDRQSKRYTEAINKNAEAIDNNTKMLGNVREVMIHINSSDDLQQKLLSTILDRLK